MYLLEGQGISIGLLAENTLGYFHVLVIKRLHAWRLIYLLR